MLNRLLTPPALMLAIGVALLSNTSKATEHPIDYSKVTNAELRGAGNLLVRYVLTADNPCLTIQYLKPGHPGVFLRERTICSLGETRFDRDFALVEFKTLDFHDDRLDVEMEFTPSRRGHKAIRRCSIALQPDSIGDLICNR